MASNGKNVIDFDALRALATKVKEMNYATEEYVADEIAKKVSSAYRPGGSLTTPNKEKLTEENYGVVYNISQEFTVSRDEEGFISGSEGTYPSGTNIVVVKDESNGSKYVFDILSGFIDLSDYPKTEGIKSIVESTLSENIVEIGEINTMLQEVFES